MAKLACGKCGRTFVHPKRKETHERLCKGARGKPASRRGGARSSPRPPLLAASANGERVRAALQELEDRRLSLQGQIDDIEQALAALAKLSGGGGR